MPVVQFGLRTPYSPAVRYVSCETHGETARGDVLDSILAAQNASVMCWEELFDNGLTLAKDTGASNQ